VCIFKLFVIFLLLRMSGLTREWNNAVVMQQIGNSVPLRQGEVSRDEISLGLDTPPHKMWEIVSWTSSSNNEPGYLFVEKCDEYIPESTINSRYAEFYGCKLEPKTMKINRNDMKMSTYDYSKRYSNYINDSTVREHQCIRLEKHDFPHIEMPIEEDSGHFVVAKIVNNKYLYISAFKIPILQTVYVPTNVIHTNDFQRGEWATGLSQNCPIDIVNVFNDENKQAVKSLKFSKEVHLFNPVMMKAMDEKVEQSEDKSDDEKVEETQMEQTNFMAYNQGEYDDDDDDDGVAKELDKELKSTPKEEEKKKNTIMNRL